MTPYQGRELALYTEALRVVPAVTAAIARRSGEDVHALHLGYQVTAAELRIPTSTAWSILATASQAALLGLVNLVAQIQGTTPTEVTERMVVAALDQVASGAL